MSGAVCGPATFADYLQLDPTLTLPHWPLTVRAAHFRTTAYRDAFFAEQALVLPEARRSAVAKRRSEFFAGRYLAKLALQDRGASSTHVPADNNRCPLWPQGMRGTISHTDTYGACAVADSGQVAALGIDIQDWLDTPPAQKLLPRILDSQEQQVLAGQPLQLNIGVSLCFSAKESIFKALYPYIGHHFGYAAAKLKAIDTADSTLTFAFDPSLHPPGLDCAALTVHFLRRPAHAVTLLCLPSP